MDISEILVAYTDRTGEMRSPHEFEKIIEWAAEIGFIEVVHQPHDFLQGSMMENKYRLATRTAEILGKKQRSKMHSE